MKKLIVAVVAVVALAFAGTAQATQQDKFDITLSKPTKVLNKVYGAAYVTRNRRGISADRFRVQILRDGVIVGNRTFYVPRSGTGRGTVMASTVCQPLNRATFQLRVKIIGRIAYPWLLGTPRRITGC